MDNDEIRISDLLYTVFKHRKTILVLGLLGFFCGFVFSGVSFLRCLGGISLLILRLCVFYDGVKINYFNEILFADTYSQRLKSQI